MSLNDDWSWWFTSENGRDNRLREEVLSTQAAIASANRANAGLRSQLSQVQGDLTARLGALSRAFDAYVELGDIREQLADFGDTRLLRLDVKEAIRALAAGQQPDELDPARYRSDNWLLPATNALIRLTGGHRDRMLEDAAISAEPEAEVFLVCCAAALGHGEALADRLAPVLATDGRWNPVQERLAAVALSGGFGTEGVAAVQGCIAPMLSGPADDWWQLLAASTPQERLAAAETLLTTTPPQAVEPTRTEVLQELVIGLVERGSGPERALIERAAELRRIVTDPQRTADDTAAESGVEIRGWLLERARAGDATVHGWLREPLLAAIATLPDSLPAAVTEREQRILGTMVAIDAESGADPAARQRLLRRGEQRVPPSTGTIAGGVVAGIATLLGIVCLVSGTTSLGLVLLVVAVIALVLGLLGWRSDRRQRADRLASDLARFDSEVATAQSGLATVAAARDAAAADYVLRRRRLLGEISV